MSQESPLANVYSINNSDFKEYIFYPSVANYTTNAAIKYLSVLYCASVGSFL